MEELGKKKNMSMRKELWEQERRLKEEVGNEEECGLK